MAAVVTYSIDEGNLYVDQNDKTVQDQARMAQAVVINLLNQNQAARERIAHECETTRATDPARFSLVSDPWFWMSLHLATHPSPSGGCCSPRDLRSNDKGDAVVLALVIAALAIAFLISAGITLKQGGEARRARAMADKIDDYRHATEDINIRDIFTRSMAIQEREWKSRSLKATFTATVTVGVACLTIAAIFALHATLNSGVVSPHAGPLLVAGGIFAGGGLTAHGVRSVYHRVRLEKDYRELHALFDEAAGLEVAHPYHVLQNFGADTAHFVLGDTCYIKEGTVYRRQRREAIIPEGSVAITL